MFLENNSPFSAFFFQQLRNDGHMMAVLSVRGTFNIFPGSPLLPCSEQDEFQDIDEYLDDELKSPLMKISDLVPYRPNADVTFIGSSFSPTDEPEIDWLTGIKVDNNSYVARIRGARYWQWYEDRKHQAQSLEDIENYSGNWELLKPEAITSVRLSPAATYGGEMPIVEGEEVRDVFHYNPIGTGILDPHNQENLTKVLAPPVLHQDTVLEDPGQIIDPVLFGPIPPFWLQRRKFTGTYNKEWKENVHPRLPADFDYRFYQYAPPGLIQNGYLKGDEPVQLANMHKDHKNVLFTLPSINLIAEMERVTGEIFDLPLNLDGLHINFTRNPAIVNLTWRNWVPYLPDIKSAKLKVVNNELMIENAKKLLGRTPLKGLSPW